MLDRLVLVAIMPLSLAGGAFGWASGKNTPQNDRGTLSTVAPEISPRNEETSPTLVVTRSNDGLFRLTVLINGNKTPMIIDTGATSSVISKRWAEKLGLQPTPSERGRLITMGGQHDYHTVAVNMITVGSLNRQDFNLIVPDSEANVNLIGQDLLQQMGSMRMVGDKITFE